MLTGRVFILSALLAGIFIVSLAGVRASTVFVSPLRSLLADEACADPPCLLAIGLHETSLEHARARLAAHDHIRSIAERARMSFTGDEHLRFDWRPGATWRPGELIASYGTVYEVWLEADIALGTLIDVLGVPPVYSYNLMRDRTGSIRLYATLYADARARLTVRIACPMTLAHMLSAQVEVIELRRVQIGFQTPSPVDSVSSWYRHMARFPMC